MRGSVNDNTECWAHRLYNNKFITIKSMAGPMLNM